METAGHLRRNSFSEPLNRPENRPDTRVGRLRRSNSMSDVSDVSDVRILPIVTPIKQSIETSFGIEDSEPIAESSLSSGQELLNKKFNRWELSKASSSTSFDWECNTNMLATAFKTMGCFVVSIHKYIWDGSQLVSKARSSQELLKNPIVATEAIVYLAGLRKKGVTVDLLDYRDSRLEKAKGTDLDLGFAKHEEAVLEKVFSKALDTVATKTKLSKKSRRELQETTDIFAPRQAAISELESAIKEISGLESSLDEQERMVAAVTHNIAIEAGIISLDETVDDQEGLRFLTDQMSSLWIRSAPEKDGTPYAVTKFANEIAEAFNPEDVDSFKKIYRKVRNHAQTFAKALLTNKPDAKKGFEEYKEMLKAPLDKYETQIWDSLKGNTIFTDKMKSAAKTITEERTRLHDYTITTEAVAKKVIGNFQEISKSNPGDQSGEKFFSMQLKALGTRMPSQMFSILGGFKGEEMSLDEIDELSPGLVQEDQSMSAVELLTAMKITQNADGDEIRFDENGGDIYALLERYNIAKDEHGTSITGFWNKKFTPETLSATLRSADWHEMEVERLVNKFDQQSSTVEAHADSLTFSKESLQATLLKRAGISNEQAQVIADNFDARTQRINVSDVIANAKGRDALPKEMVLSEVIKNHKDEETGKVNIFKVFTDPYLLDDGAINTEMLRGNGREEADAKVNLFKRWVSYSNSNDGIMSQYQKALDFMRVEGAPSKQALDHYDAAKKREEINALQKHLFALTQLATMGSVSKELQDAKTRGGRAPIELKDLSIELKDLMLKDAYIESLELSAVGDIKTAELDRRFNLQDEDYYSMLSNALGLREARTTGSATLTRELLTFLKERDTDENRPDHSSTAHLLITKGRMSYNEYLELCRESRKLQEINEEIIEMLKEIVSDVHNTNTISMKLKGLEKDVTLEQFTDKLNDFRAYLQAEVQPVLTRRVREVRAPVYMIENGNIKGLIDAADNNVSTLALCIANTLNSNADSYKKIALAGDIGDALNGLREPEQREEALLRLQQIVEESKLPENPEIIDGIPEEDDDDEFVDALNLEILDHG